MYALIGVCLVLSYRVGAVINFSQTFTATLAVFVMSEFLDRGWNLWLSIGIGDRARSHHFNVPGMDHGPLVRRGFGPRAIDRHDRHGDHASSA